MGCGSGMNCWRRLRDRQAAGVWDRLHEVLLARPTGLKPKELNEAQTRGPKQPAPRLLQPVHADK